MGLGFASQRIFLRKTNNLAFAICIEIQGPFTWNTNGNLLVAVDTQMGLEPDLVMFNSSIDGRILSVNRP